jgi:hypothetical protein
MSAQPFRGIVCSDIQEFVEVFDGQGVTGFAQKLQLFSLAKRWV